MNSEQVEVKSVRLYNSGIAKILRGLFYISKCPICGKGHFRIGKRDSNIAYSSFKGKIPLIFWGVPIITSDYVCRRCKKGVVLVLTNLKGVHVIHRKDSKLGSLEKLFLDQAAGMTLVIEEKEYSVKEGRLSISIGRLIERVKTSEEAINRLFPKYLVEEPVELTKD